MSTHAQPYFSPLHSNKASTQISKGSIDYGLYYCKSPLTFNAYCDADWASNPDDKCSTTGYGIFLGSNLISWSAKKQNVVSRSSIEAEYRSMCLTITEMYWIRMLLKELHLPLLSPPTLWCDNSGALALASNLCSMHVLNILRWTFTSFGKRSPTMISNSNTCLHLTR
jgi:hypothetical protein